MPSSADFTFLSDDVRRQRELAQEALDEAKRLSKLLNGKSTIDPELKENLEKTKDRLLNVARSLAANAASTSSAATIALLNSGDA
jgi:hypothetical protein